MEIRIIQREPKAKLNRYGSDDFKDTSKLLLASRTYYNGGYGRKMKIALHV